MAYNVSNQSQSGAHGSKKHAANPLPYIIVFAILFLIGLGVLTWFLGVFYKAHECSIYPNIWCSDTWTCGTTGCTTSGGHAVNTCFNNVGITGLASCLFGPNVSGATACFFTPTSPTGITGGTAGTGGELTCDCPSGMSGISNCFNGCVQSLDQLDPTTLCCCNNPAIPACLASKGACTPTT